MIRITYIAIWAFQLLTEQPAFSTLQTKINFKSYKTSGYVQFIGHMLSIGLSFSLPP